MFLLRQQLTDTPSVTHRGLDNLAPPSGFFPGQTFPHFFFTPRNKQVMLPSALSDVPAPSSSSPQSLKRPLPTHFRIQRLQWAYCRCSMLVGLPGLLVVLMPMPRVSSIAVVVLGPPPISGRTSAFEPLGAGAAGRTPSVNAPGLSSISETAPHTTSLLWTSVSSAVVWVALHPPCGFTAACAVNHPHRCHWAVPCVIISVPVYTVVQPSPPPTSRNFHLPQQKLCPHETPAPRPVPLAPPTLLSPLWI